MAAVERSRCQAIGAYLRNRIKESPLKVRQKPDSAPKHFITLNQIKPILERGPIDQLLYCLCEKCQEYSGFSADERRSRFRNDELEEKYFTVFALLLTEHCAGLIWEFHKREITLGPQRIYNEQLEFLEDLVGSLFTHHEVTDVRDRILKHQFIFFAQPLETRNTEKEIAPEEALPIDEEESPIGEGGFGKVYAFKILEEYKGAGYKDLDTDKFARKIFEANKKTSGLDEWCNLMRIYNLLDKPHPHLIETMGAFQYGDTFSIIFPRADKSLEQYLKTEASYPSEYIWEQMQGIIEGLAYLHGLPNDDVENSSKDGKKKQKKDSTFMALHLDLKPDNILIVKGRMQIADFGLSQVKDRLSLEQSKNSSNIPGNAGGYMAYAPPEYPRLAKNPHAGHDLWSMAAILSEMATHDIGPTDAEANEGQAPVELYREKRRLEEDKGYYRSWSFHYDDKLKQSVRIQHDKLLQAAQNTESRGENELWQSFFYRADFFGLIEQMLAKDRTERGTARDVADALEILLTDTKRNMKNKLSHMRIPPRDTLTIWDEAESHKLQKDYGKPEDVHFLKAIYKISAPSMRYSLVRCVIFLEESPSGDVLEMQVLRRTQENRNDRTEEKFLVKRTDVSEITGFVPDFAIMRSDGNDQSPIPGLPEKRIKDLLGVTIHGPGKMETFHFIEPEDIDHFQPLLVHQYPVSRFYRVSWVKFTYRYPRKSNRKEGNFVLQLWYNYDLLGGRRSYEDISRIARVALLTPRKLYLIKIRNDFELPRTTEIRLNNPIKLNPYGALNTHKIEITESPEYKIPVILDAPKGYKTKYKHASIAFANASDIPSFWDELGRLQRNLGVGAGSGLTM